MGIASFPLDGQNIGIQLTAPNVTADVLSVDVLSGTITSSVLSASQLSFLAKAKDELFTLVPFAARGNIGFLSRFVTVSAADASSVTLSAVNAGGNVWTLRATISAAPGNLVVHVPYSADGNLAWASASASGGGGASVPTLFINAPATTSVAAGNVASIQFMARNPDGSAWTGGDGFFWVELTQGSVGDLNIAATVGTIVTNRWLTSSLKVLVFTNGAQATLTFQQSAPMPAPATFKVAAGPGPGAGWPGPGVLGSSPQVEIVYT